MTVGLPTNQGSGEELILAAVDLGSNSFHMIVARYVHGQLQVIDRLREMVQLASGLDADGNLDDSSAQRAIECLSRFGQRLAGIPFAHVRALATNTFRRLKEPGNFLQDAENALGHPIEVVSEHEEARLVYLGVAHGLASPTGKRLVIDIGGGSTEFIVGVGYDPIELESVSCGCVGISQKYFPNGKVSRAHFKEAETEVALQLRPIRGRFRAAGWTETVGSSGTIRAIEQILIDTGHVTSGVTLPGLKRLRRIMQDMGDARALTELGLSEKRAQVLPGGVAILMACFRNFEIEHMQVSDLALREGALRDLVGRAEHHDPREAAVEALAVRYYVDETQAEQVQQTALHAFDQIGVAWELTDFERSLLSWSARLHEIGLSISHTQHQAHGAYLAEHSPLAGFSRMEQLALATLIRGHRGKLDPAIFSPLPLRLVHGVKHACVILRLAVLLHRSRVPDSLPTLLWSGEPGKLNLEFPRRWLSGHPLTKADLSEEMSQLEKIDLTLRY